MVKPCLTIAGRAVRCVVIAGRAVRCTEARNFLARKECWLQMDTEMSDTGGQPNPQPPAGAANPVWKQFAVCGSRFVLPDHYEVIKPIGQGAYGVVW